MLLDGAFLDGRREEGIAFQAANERLDLLSAPAFEAENAESGK